MFGLRYHLHSKHNIGDAKRTRKQSISWADSGKSFTHGSLYGFHMLKKHGKEVPELRNFVCPHCENVEHTDRNHKAHMMLHTADRFVCRDCGYATRYDANLIKHARLVHKKKLTNPSEFRVKGDTLVAFNEES